MDNFFIVTSYDPISAAIMASLISLHPDIDCRTIESSLFLPQATDHFINQFIEENAGNKLSRGAVVALSAFELQHCIPTDRQPNSYRHANIKLPPAIRIRLLLLSWLRSGTSIDYLVAHLEQQLNTPGNSLYLHQVANYYQHITARLFAHLQKPGNTLNLSDVSSALNKLFLLAFAVQLAFDAANASTSAKSFRLEKILANRIEFCKLIHYITANEVTFSEKFENEYNVKLQQIVNVIGEAQKISFAPWQVALFNTYFDDCTEYFDLNAKQTAFMMTNKDELGHYFGLLKRLDLFDKFGIEAITQEQEMDPTKAYYIVIKVKMIDLLSDADTLLDKITLARFHSHPNSFLLYDLSNESITFSDYTSKKLIRFHEILREAKIDPRKVILLCSNANAAERYPVWAATNHFTDYQIRVIGFHFYLYEYYWQIDNCDWIQNHRYTFLQSAKQTVTQNKKRQKHYICLNLRPRSHRTAVVLHLLERNHLEKGHVTYFGEDFADAESIDKQDERISFVNRLKSRDRLLSQLERLNHLTPMMFDRDAVSIRKDLWDRKHNEVEFLFPTGEQLDNYFEIITETWLTDQSNLYITEKTVRPILRLQPFIHIGAPKLLAYLRSIGFQTFSPFINEEYDEILNPYERLECIFTEIDRLCNMSIDEIHQLYCDLWPRLLHNFNHFTLNTADFMQRELRSTVLDKLVPA